MWLTGQGRLERELGGGERVLQAAGWFWVFVGRRREGGEELEEGEVEEW
jgi:hypothetical protein